MGSASGLLVAVKEIATAYRNDTSWGRSALNELENQPFRRCRAHGLYAVVGEVSREHVLALLNTQMQVEECSSSGFMSCYQVCHLRTAQSDIVTASCYSL